MSSDWQALAAATVVILTAAVFVIRMARPRGKRGCGGGCGCAKKTHR